MEPMGETTASGDFARPSSQELPAESARTYAPGRTHAPGRAASPREAFNQWFVTHEVAWELLMAALAIAYVAIGFLADEIETAAEQDAHINPSPEIGFAELALTAFFAAEFVARIAAARSRTGYLRGHWIDLVALAPPIRGARVLRLLRLLRLVRAFAGLYRAGLHVRGLARHRGFAWLLFGWIGVMVLCSAWMYVAEHGVNKAIDNPFDALWWGVVTLTTVGYGDVYPVTAEGRLAAMCLMLLGIGLFGAITATITSYIVAGDLARVEAKIDADTVLDATDLALDQSIADRVGTTKTTSATESRLAERTASAGGTLVADLERLAALHRSGDLTAVEFDRAKARLLEAAS
jgi:voltage-gated potassium channel